VAPFVLTPAATWTWIVSTDGPAALRREFDEEEAVSASVFSDLLPCRLAEDNSGDVGE
jgi:hypothetical protein